MNRHLIDMINKYEDDLLDADEIIALFQELIDTGIAWQLQRHYSRTAKRLIDNGFCEKK